MNKLFLSIILFCLLSIIFVPVFSQVQASECPPPPGQQPGLVRCGLNSSCPCEIDDFFKTLVYIYNFIVLMIATPLAVIAIIVGAIFMMVSAGNPTTFGKGKTILWSAVIGLVLVFGSYLIINFILTTLKFAGSWANPF